MAQTNTDDDDDVLINSITRLTWNEMSGLWPIYHARKRSELSRLR